jgi:hypothetical protein
MSEIRIIIHLLDIPSMILMNRETCSRLILEDESGCPRASTSVGSRGAHVIERKSKTIRRSKPVSYADNS